MNNRKESYILRPMSRMAAEEPRDSPPACLPSEAAANLSSAFTSLYGMLLVCVYVAFVFTELVTFPKYQLFLEVHGFFVFLYATAAIYLALILAATATGKGVVENHKVRMKNVKADLDSTREIFVTLAHLFGFQSHGSLTIRVGCLIFSLGTLTYFALEAVAFAEVRSSSACYHGVLGFNVAFALIVVALQAFLVVVFPRLNVVSFPSLNRFDFGLNAIFTVFY